VVLSFIRPEVCRERYRSHHPGGSPASGPGVASRTRHVCYAGVGYPLLLCRDLLITHDSD